MNIIYLLIIKEIYEGNEQTNGKKQKDKKDKDETQKKVEKEEEMILKLMIHERRLGITF